MLTVIDSWNHATIGSIYPQYLTFLVLFTYTRYI